MRVTKLEIKDFGKFTDEKVIDNIDEKIALFYGSNESGKTTLFNLIKTIFYGFYPARADSHPYASWKNGRIEFTSHLNTDDGKKIVVYRKLMSNPQGKYFADGKYKSLNNRTIPEAKHISKEIYDKIYALRVEDLVDIRGKAWEEVEDKLLGNYGTDIIRNTRDVLKDLSDEIEKIWRESNRGNFLIKNITNEISELIKKKKEAFLKEEETRKADRRVFQINQEMDTLMKEKLLIKTMLNKSKELKPVKNILDQIKNLEDKLIREEEIYLLPGNTREKLQDHDEDLNEIKVKLEEKKKQLQERKDEIYIFSEYDRTILKNKSKIKMFSTEYNKLQNMEENIKKINNTMLKLKERLERESVNVLTEKWHDDLRGKFEKIHKSEFQILVNNLKNIKAQLHEARLKKDLEITDIDKVKLSKSYILAAILGIMLMVGGIFIDNIPIQLAGLGGLVFGLSGILNYRSMKKFERNLRNRKDLNILDKKLRELEGKFREERARLVKYLDGIPISDLVIDNMDEILLMAFIKIKEMVYELEELEKELEGLNKEYLNKRMELDGFLSQFQFNNYIKENEKIYLLSDRVEELEKKDLINESLNKEIKEIEGEVDILEHKDHEISGILNQYKDSLRKIGKGDIEKGLDIVEENERVKRKIESLREDLHSNPNADILIKEIKDLDRKDEWIFSEYETAKAEERLENINQKIRELTDERARLQTIIERMEEDVTLDEIESRIFILEEELNRACRKRDRLALLSEVIKFADQKFKEENQPDVLKNASRYFNIITEGRYSDIYIEELEERCLMVRETGQAIPMKVVDTFSKGTLNQLYLALRLSLIDHLDRDKETLPVCFDELLVNWDQMRLDNSLKLIMEMSKRRQIFIFTCHEWMAEKMENFFNVKRIAL